jgi:hypothetical protein
LLHFGLFVVQQTAITSSAAGLGPLGAIPKGSQRVSTTTAGTGPIAGSSSATKSVPEKGNEEPVVQPDVQPVVQDNEEPLIRDKAEEIKQLRAANNTSVTATYDWITKVQREMSLMIDGTRTFQRLGDLLTMSMDVEVGLNAHANAYADAVRPFIVTKAIESLREAKVAQQALENNRQALRVRQISYQVSTQNEKQQSHEKQRAIE